MKDLVAYEGHFWINVDEILTEKRKKELKEDLESTDRLLVVNDELWARIETPHPTKRQKIVYKAKWRPEEIEMAGSLKKMPGIRE